MDANAHEQLVSFIVLQLLAALKMLQSDGVEALSTNFKVRLVYPYTYKCMSHQCIRRYRLPQIVWTSFQSLSVHINGLIDEWPFKLRPTWQLSKNRGTVRANSRISKLRFQEFLLSYQFSPDSQAELWEFPRLIFLPVSSVTSIPFLLKIGSDSNYRKGSGLIAP